MFLIVAATLALTACGTTGPFGLTREPLPTSTQLRTFVETNWTTPQDKVWGPFASRFGFARGRPEETATFVDVRNAVCGYVSGRPSCWFDIVAAFPGEPSSRARIETAFVWEGARLAEPIDEVVLVH